MNDYAVAVQITRGNSLLLVAFRHKKDNWCCINYEDRMFSLIIIKKIIKFFSIVVCVCVCVCVSDHDL